MILVTLYAIPEKVFVQKRTQNVTQL